MFMDLVDLVEEISTLAVVGIYHNMPLKEEAKSILAGSSFLQYLNKLFQIQYQLEISYNLNLEIVANTICFQRMEPGMR